MAQQFFLMFWFSLCWPISSRAFLRLRLRLEKGTCHLPRKALEGARVSPWPPSGEAAAASQAAGRAGSLTKPLSIPAIVSHPALPSTGTGFWFGHVAGFWFNIWDLVRISHYHKKQREGQNFKKCIFSFLLPFPWGKRIHTRDKWCKNLPPHKRLPWEQGILLSGELCHIKTYKM